GGQAVGAEGRVPGGRRKCSALPATRPFTWPGRPLAPARRRGSPAAAGALAVGGPAVGRPGRRRGPGRRPGSGVLWGLVLQSGADLGPQLGVVRVPVHRNGVLGRGADDFLLLTGDGEGALGLAREVPAVGYLAHDAHLLTPPQSRTGGAPRRPARTPPA